MKKKRFILRNTQDVRHKEKQEKALKLNNQALKVHGFYQVATGLNKIKRYKKIYITFLLIPFFVASYTKTKIRYKSLV